MVKVIFKLCSFIFLIVLFSKIVFAHEKSIYFFYGNGCPHCSLVEEYFEKNKLYIKYPIEKKEIYSNKENSILFISIMDKQDIPQQMRGVPTVVLGSDILVGDKSIISDFISKADIFLLESESNSAAINQPLDSIGKKNDLTIFAVIAAAIVDAINPCAFAVLIILMSTILASGMAKKALSAGIAFSASIFISYFLMGLGLYSAMSIGSMAQIFYKFVGWLAIILGLFNLKDYFWYGKGFLMEVPLSWRPAMKKLIGSVTTAKGAFSIGFLVSLFLLPCTSGPYIVILGMLAKKSFDIQAIFYLLLYNFIFISPMVFISWAVYKGYDPSNAEGIRQKRLRLLHLIAGIIMLGMGTMILMGLV